MSNLHHKTLTSKKWQEYPKERQILMLGSELLRAKNWLMRKDEENSKLCLERALEILDFIIADRKWQKERQRLLRFREVLAECYLNLPEAGYIMQIFYDWLTGIEG